MVRKIFLHGLPTQLQHNAAMSVLLPEAEDSPGSFLPSLVASDTTPYTLRVVLGTKDAEANGRQQVASSSVLLTGTPGWDDWGSQPFELG